MARAGISSKGTNRTTSNRITHNKGTAVISRGTISIHSRDTEDTHSRVMVDTHSKHTAHTHSRGKVGSEVAPVWQWVLVPVCLVVC